MATEKRLIDAHDLWSDIMMLPHNGDMISSEEVEQAIIEATTVDAAEVVYAEWLDIRFDSMWKSMLATCSHCKVRGEVRVKSNECGFAVPDSDHCPHCGAKMYGGINK